MNNITMVGRLTRDPEMKYIQSSNKEIAVARFTLAVDRDYKNKDGTTTTDFIPVEIMGKPAEFVANYVTKGRLVGIEGSMRVDRYEKDGEQKSFTKVSARRVQALESAKKDSVVSNIEKINEQASFSAIEGDDVPF